MPHFRRLQCKIDNKNAMKMSTLLAGETYKEDIPYGDGVSSSSKTLLLFYLFLRVYSVFTLCQTLFKALYKYQAFDSHGNSKRQ